MRYSAIEITAVIINNDSANNHSDSANNHSDSANNHSANIMTVLLMTMLILLGWTGGLLLKWQLTLSMVSKWNICIKGWVSESCYPLPPPPPPPIHICHKKKTVCDNRHAVFFNLTVWSSTAFFFFKHCIFLIIFCRLASTWRIWILPIALLCPPPTCHPPGQHWADPYSWTPAPP